MRPEVAGEYSLRVLEFDKILARLAGHCSWAGGRELVLALRPSPDAEEVRNRLQETSEALVLTGEEGFTLGGVRDIRRAVARAQIGATLEAAELLDVASTLAASRRLRDFLGEKKDLAPRLAALAPQLVSFPELERSITTAITPQGEVADGASPRLARIRRSIKLLQARLRDQMESYVRSPQFLRHLQEPIVTVRDGRYVLPVKVEARAQVPGIIHDQSATGATLFIEPMATVDMNNELRRLSLEEKEEVARILGQLSAAVGMRGGDIESAMAALAAMDLAVAKAAYAQALQASCPILDERGLDFRAARHPLLGQHAVPIDLALGEDYDTLVISGPNTGGKTVALKTAGLLTLMAQAGLHIPCQEGSRATVFRRVFADIGDEQSIEQSLSTFSSHMRNIIATLGEAGPRTLVLLDELGAGTDPAQGAALGMAILERLQEAGCRTVVTTHSGELKAWAYARPGVESAAVEFDPVTLEPTYRLQVGTPGFSNAFTIAARLGLPPEVVARAREFLSQDQQRVETLLAGLAEDSRQLHRELEEARRARQEADSAREEARRILAELRANEEAIRARVRLRGQELADVLGRQADAVREALRRAQREEDRRERQLALEEARETLRRLRRQAEAIAGESSSVAGLPAAVNPRTRVEVPEPKERWATAGGAAAGGPGGALLPGARVRVLSLGREGYLLGGPDADGRVQVQVGIMRTQVPVHDVVPEASPRESVGEIMVSKARVVSPELHVRGMTVDEALDALAKYLDDAILAGMASVRVVHGKGTGTLRKAVAEYLRQHPQVKSFRIADAAEGGEGATVVALQ